MAPAKKKPCEVHPYYQGLRKPRTECEACWTFYNKQVKKRERAKKKAEKEALAAQPEPKKVTKPKVQTKAKKPSKPKAQPKPKAPKPDQPIGEVISLQRMKTVSCVLCGHNEHVPKSTDPDTFLCGECTKHVPSNKSLLLAACPYDGTRLRIVQVHEHTYGDIVWFQCDECGRIIEVCDNTSMMKYTLVSRPDYTDGCTILSVLRNASGEEDWAPKNPTAVAKAKKASRKRKKASSE